MSTTVKSSLSKSRTQKETFGKIAFGIVIILFIIVAAICGANAIKWANKHFPGFLINERMVVAPVGLYHWTGNQVDLKYPDKILAANGTAISSKTELERILNRSYIGTPIVYKVARGGTRFSVTVATMQFTWTDLLMTFGPTFVAAIAFMLIGTVVFIMKPNIQVSWTLLIACTFLSLWSITIFDMQSTHFGFIHLYLIASALAPAAFVHFSFYFPEHRQFIKKRPNLQWIPWIIGLAIAIPLEIRYPRSGFQIFFSLAQVYIIVAALIVISTVAHTFFRSRSVLARQRAKVVLTGAAFGFPIPAIAYFSQLILGSFLGVKIQTHLLTLPMIIFPASMAYAIAKHNLFDVDVYIKRTVGYAIITAIVVGGYLGISIPINVLLGKYEIAQTRAFPILFTLAVILVFNPLYSRVQAFVDRVFFRKEYNYGEIVDKVGNAMTSLLDLPQILKRLAITFTEDLFINTSSVMLLTSGNTEFRVYLSEGENSDAVERINLDRNSPLIEIIEEQKTEITKYDVLEDPKYKDVSESCAANFDDLNASLMVPLIYQNNVIGLLNLGEKKSGKFLSREDVELARTLANQGAMAIENARLFQENLEKQRMEEELAIGRELQMSMLPADCPHVEGFEIAAFSESAREVGGDFYDFIEISNAKSGIVIGDVTGKSVSGALVMSASRSIFRMLGENELTVSESMIRANRRTKKDIKTGMFVALLYAVLGSDDKTLTLCSAGQTHPVFRSAVTGETKLVETEGDSFPLGILEDAEYEETRLQLETGDKVVLYTDGIVEAMNDQEEMFGFDRLLETIQESKTLTAQSLLDEINAQVNEFTGSAPQHDDITIIVIQAT